MSTGIATNESGTGKALTLRDRLQSPAFLEAVGKVAPGHCKPERMARVAMTALTRVPKLANCDPQSFLRCMMDLSAWGLEPDGRSAHLIPFENRKRGVTECQLIIDYKGLVELAYRSGKISSIHADIVCESDQFTYDRGEVKVHTYKLGAPRGGVIGVYCRVVFKDGSEKHEVMDTAAVEAVRARSMSGSSGPWRTDWNEMAKKTVFRRASKWLPLSAEVKDAYDREDEQEAHVSQASMTDERPRGGGTQTQALLESLQSDEPATREAAVDSDWQERFDSAEPAPQGEESPPDVQKEQAEASADAPLTEDEKALIVFGEALAECQTADQVSALMERMNGRSSSVAVVKKMVDMGVAKSNALRGTKKKG